MREEALDIGEPDTARRIRSPELRRAAGGDRDAFDRLVRPHLGNLMALARRLTTGEHLAEELLQTTLIRAYAGLRHFRGDAPLRVWISSILYRLATEPHRLAGPGAPPAGRTTALPDDVPDALGVDPSVRVSARDMLARVEAAMERLPVRLRTALHLRTVEGWGYDGIARVLETSVSAARNAVMDARRRLRERIGDVLEP